MGEAGHQVALGDAIFLLEHRGFVALSQEPAELVSRIDLARFVMAAARAARIAVVVAQATPSALTIGPGRVGLRIPGGCGVEPDHFPAIRARIDRSFGHELVDAEPSSHHDGVLFVGVAHQPKGGGFGRELVSGQDPKLGKPSEWITRGGVFGLVALTAATAGQSQQTRDQITSPRAGLSSEEAGGIAIQGLAELDDLACGPIDHVLDAIGKAVQFGPETLRVEPAVGEQGRAPGRLGQVEGIVGLGSHRLLQGVYLLRPNLPVGADVFDHAPCQSRIGSPERDRVQVP